MSSRFSRTTAPLVLELTPSRWLRVIHVSVVLLALVAIFCTPFSWLLQIALSAIVLGGVFYARPRAQLCRLTFDRQWRCRWRDGRESILQLDSAVLWPALIVLRFRDTQSECGFSTVLLPDSLLQNDLLQNDIDANGWRRLRVYLHHHDVFNEDKSGGDESDPAALD